MPSHGSFAIPSRATKAASGSARALALASICLTLGVVGSLAPSAAHAARGGTASSHGATERAAKPHPHSNPRRRTVLGTLAALPPIAQPGTVPAAPSNKGALVASFTPASPGQQVTLERQTRNGWRAVATAEEDAWGSAAFAPSPGTYRARTTSDGLTWVTGRVTTARWQPSFEDTFSGTSLDTSVWNDQKREHESVYAPRTCARTDPTARRVSGGVLHLGIALDPALAGTPCAYTSTRAAGTTSGTSPYLLNSQVATENTRLFQHGIVAARIKPQRAKGMHSGFWLLPAGTVYADGDPAAGAEIDVMEFFGDNGRGTETISSSIHYYQAGWNKISLGDPVPAARRILAKRNDWWDEFHVFSVEWTPQEYVFRVDGREYYREQTAVSQAQQYLVLSNLTSDYELADLTADELGDTAQVDWVRVFDARSASASRTSKGRRAGR